MANEERENEEAGIETGLGEIAEDLMREQGENFPPDYTYIPGNEMPADLRAATPLGDAPVDLEDKTQGASVRSVFDTRLINGTDFQATDAVEVTPSGELDATATISFVVPQSYVAILREIEWHIDPLNGEPGSTLTLSIKVNGISQVGHTDLNIPDQTDTPWKTHILAPENSTIEMVFLFPAGYSEAINYNVFAHMYGNLILARQVPLAFEVGNPVASKSVPVPPAVNAPDPMAMQQTPVKAPPIRPPGTGGFKSPHAQPPKIKRSAGPRKRKLGSFFSMSKGSGGGRRGGRINPRWRR